MDFLLKVSRYHAHQKLQKTKEKALQQQGSDISKISTLTFTATAPRYVTIGCFQDRSSRAIPTLEGQDSILDGGYTARKDAIEKCYQVAKKRGFQVFAVQNGGWCAASRLAAITFNKYGKSSACKSDGEGGPWANQVYYIKGKQTLA